MSQMIYGPVEKHSVVVGKVKTAISIEARFWKLLKEIAVRRHVSIARIVTDIDFDRNADEHCGTKGNLSSAIRQFVLLDVLERIEGLETRAAGGLPSQGAQAGATATQ